MLKKQEFFLDELEFKIKSAIDEEEKHFKRFFSACEKLKTSFPFDEKTLEDEEKVEHLDQMTWRFIKIQDSIGRRLIPYVVEYNFDTIDGLTFRDMLNKLEKLELLNSQEWNIFRVLRNDITHVYPDDDKLLETLNEVYLKKDLLYAIYKNLRNSI
ncbi:MAG: hypothetical protein PHO62_09720 [Sulfurimonas sp.]|uniref:hypothetical protein n=1 Tax=Sulfurimonas sp. TaxID=2022749 RepID=UPI00260CBE11|nr:hypothetical protein [Sulfurimonas sp.]MDD5373686.1 hypothetical protein [Sulfurimonas sp.]